MYNSGNFRISGSFDPDTFNDFVLLMALRGLRPAIGFLDAMGSILAEYLPKWMDVDPFETTFHNSSVVQA